MTTHIIHGMSNALYHQHPSASSSMLKTILRSPAHYFDAYLSGKERKPPTPTMLLGTMTHTAYLEPELFNSEYVVAPDVDRRTKDGKAAWADFLAMNDGLTVVSAEQVDLAQAMASALRRHGLHEAIKMGGHFESSIFYTNEETGLDLRIRPDWHMPPCEDWPTGVIVDLKSTDDARPEAFARTCVNFGYDLSASMYCEGFRQHYQTEEDPLYLLLVVERDAPHGVMAYEASGEMIAKGDAKYRRALALLEECNANESWPCYPEEIVKLDLPKWA